MPPRLPRLTLYTGGKECSLCEVFKVELDKIRRTHPFELEYWNIRDPPTGTNERDSKKWRRLYQYDILTTACAAPRRETRSETSHRRSGIARRVGEMAQEQSGGRARKGGSDGGSGSDIDIDVEDDDVSISASSAEEGEIRSTPPSGVQPSTSSRSAFKPYISVLDTITSSVTTSPPSTPSANRLKRSPISSSAQERSPKRLPPWRNALGRAYFAINPEFDASCSSSTVHVAPGEEDAYRTFLERAYANFCDIPVGSDVPIDDKDNDNDDTLDVIIDSEPKRYVFPGETITSYDTATIQPKTTPRSKGRSNAVQIDRTCWNCGGDDHNMPDCPRPRNYQRIDKARRDFMQQKEVARSTMPEWHRPYLDAYVCTPDERKRRLKRATQLRPNNPSSRLLDALFFVEPVDEDEVVNRSDLTAEQSRRFEEEAFVNARRRRGEMPWFEQMMRWGYPPGWIAQRDPIDEAKRRIRIDPLTEEVDSDSDDDDLLEVFGDFGAGPDPSDTEAPRSPAPPSPPPEPDDAPPPPPPGLDRPYRKWWELLPPARNTPTLFPRRWVAYKTDLFDWQRLHPFDPVRPMPMPLPMRL